MPKPEYRAVMEWDRPNEGQYDDGSIRIITSRQTGTNAVGDCHKASEEEVRWVLQMEQQYAIWDTLDTIFRFIRER